MFYPRKAKNAVTCLVTTFCDCYQVVPPGIEPGTQGFSVLCSTNWAMAPSYWVIKLCYKWLRNSIFFSDTRPFQFGLQRGLHSRFCKERYLFRFHCECKGKQISQTCKSFLENLQLFCPQTIIQPRLEPLSIQHQPFRKSFQNHPEPFGQVDILHLSCLFKQRGNLGRTKPCYSATDFRYQKFQLWMLLCKLDKLVHIGLDCFHSTLHGRYGIALPLQSAPPVPRQPRISDMPTVQHPRRAYLRGCYQTRRFRRVGV